MIIDPEQMRECAKAALPCSDGRLGVVVSPAFLVQVAAELEEGRVARAQLARQGSTFGLGVKL